MNFVDPLGLDALGSDAWVNYGKYGANYSEFQKPIDVDLRPLVKLGSCFAKCMALKGVPPPLVLHGGIEMATHFLKHTKYLARVAGPVAIVGWAWFGHEGMECMEECGENNGCK